MNKIITLTGNKYCGKLTLAYKLSRNSEVEFVKPYTDKPFEYGVDPEKYGDYHIVSEDTLDTMIEEEEVLCSTKINGSRYVIFMSQIQSPYSVIIADDCQLMDIKEKWSNLYTIKVHGRNEKPSRRVGVYFYDKEFDEVFNYNEDDFDLLEARIE